MAFTPFTKNDQPTMQAFNDKFQQAISEAVSRSANAVVGTYVGTGTESADIPLGFTPDAVIVHQYSSFTDDSGYSSAFILPGLPNVSSVKRAEIIDGGFRVYYYSSSTISKASLLNYSGSTYRYIAFKNREVT